MFRSLTPDYVAVPKELSRRSRNEENVAAAIGENLSMVAPSRGTTAVNKLIATRDRNFINTTSGTRAAIVRRDSLPAVSETSFPTSGATFPF